MPETNVGHVRHDFVAADSAPVKSLLQWTNPVATKSADEIRKENGLTALLDRILLLPYTVQRVTPSGIHLTPETQRQEENATEFAVVIDIGEYAYNKLRSPLEVGDHVMVTKYGGEVTYGATGTKFRTATDRMIVHRMDPNAWEHLRQNLATFRLPERG